MVPIAGDVVTPQQYVDAFARIKGVQVRLPPLCYPRSISITCTYQPLHAIQATYSQLSLEFFRTLPIPGAELIVQMYEWYHAGCPGKFFTQICSVPALSHHVQPNLSIHTYASTCKPGEGHTRDPAATRALCSHVRNLEVRTDICVYERITQPPK